MNDHLKLIAVEKPSGKFIATYKDGSSSDMFQEVGSFIFDCNGEIRDYEELEDYFLYWIPLPDDFEFWVEVKDA